MKTATKNLEDDHVHILKLTHVMEAVTIHEKPSIEHITVIVDIIRKFADGIHHAKEEELLFPLLEEKGFSSTQGPVSVMLNEHKTGRNFVKQISDNLVLYKTGSESALAKINEGMTGYASLLRAHIAKENNVLFRMADRALSESDHTALLAQFKTAESKREPASGFIGKIEELSEFYGI